MYCNLRKLHPLHICKYAICIVYKLLDAKNTMGMQNRITADTDYCLKKYD